MGYIPLSFDQEEVTAFYRYLELSRPSRKGFFKFYA